MEAEWEGFYLNDEKKEGKGVPLSKGKGGSNFWKEGVEHEGGSGITVEGGTQRLRTGPKPMASRTRSTHCRQTLPYP